MPFVKTDPNTMECFMEKLMRGNGFVLIKDGSKNGELTKGKVKPSFFRRIYRLQLDGEFVNTWVYFTYDLRTGWADFKITTKCLEEYERLTKEPEDKEIAELTKKEVTW